MFIKSIQFVAGLIVWTCFAPTFLLAWFLYWACDDEDSATRPQEILEDYVI